MRCLTRSISTARCSRGNGDSGVSTIATESGSSPMFSQKLGLSMVADMNRLCWEVKNSPAKPETSIGFIDMVLMLPSASVSGLLTTKFPMSEEISCLAWAASS